MCSPTEKHGFGGREGGRREPSSSWWGGGGHGQKFYLHKSLVAWICPAWITWQGELMVCGQGKTGFQTGLFCTAEEMHAAVLVQGSDSPCGISGCAWCQPSVPPQDSFRKFLEGNVEWKKKKKTTKKRYSIEIPVVGFGMFLMGCPKWGRCCQLWLVGLLARGAACFLVWEWKDDAWKALSGKLGKENELDTAFHLLLFLLLNSSDFFSLVSLRQLGCGPRPGLLASATAYIITATWSREQHAEILVCSASRFFQAAIAERSRWQEGFLKEHRRYLISKLSMWQGLNVRDFPYREVLV